MIRRRCRNNVAMASNLAGEAGHGTGYYFNTDMSITTVTNLDTMNNETWSGRLSLPQDRVVAVFKGWPGFRYRREGIRYLEHIS